MKELIDRWKAFKKSRLPNAGEITTILRTDIGEFLEYLSAEPLTATECCGECKSLDGFQGAMGCSDRNCACHKPAEKQTLRMVGSEPYVLQLKKCCNKCSSDPFGTGYSYKEKCVEPSCPCHRKEEKIGKGLCNIYHTDDCCPKNERCGFYVPSTAEEKCKSSPNCSHNKNGRDMDKPCSISFPAPPPLKEIEELTYDFDTNAYLQDVHIKLNELIRAVNKLRG